MRRKKASQGIQHYWLKEGWNWGKNGEVNGLERLLGGDLDHVGGVGRKGRAQATVENEAMAPLALLLEIDQQTNDRTR